MTSITHSKLNISSEYLYDLLQMIRKRPGMYLGSCGVTRLRFFLEGYAFARLDLGLTETKEEKEFKEFSKWVQKRFNIKSNLEWNKIIILHYEDERDAFQVFFTLLAKFCEETTNSSKGVSSENHFTKLSAWHEKSYLKSRIMGSFG